MYPVVRTTKERRIITSSRLGICKLRGAEEGKLEREYISQVEGTRELYSFVIERYKNEKSERGNFE